MLEVFSVNIETGVFFLLNTGWFYFTGAEEGNISQETYKP